LKDLHNTAVYCVAFTPDGTLLASGSDCFLPIVGNIGEIILWDWPSGQAKARLRGHTTTVRCLAFSRDGKRLASGSGDTVRLWDVAAGKKMLACDNPGNSGVSSVVFSPDGSTVVSAHNDKVVKLWDAATGKQRANLQGQDSVAFSPDGTT